MGLRSIAVIGNQCQQQPVESSPEEVGLNLCKGYYGASGRRRSFRHETTFFFFLPKSGFSLQEGLLAMDRYVISASISSKVKGVNTNVHRSRTGGGGGGGARFHVSTTHPLPSFSFGYKLLRNSGETNQPRDGHLALCRRTGSPPQLCAGRTNRGLSTYVFFFFPARRRAQSTGLCQRDG